MSNQFPKSEIETWKKWARIGFTWYRFVEEKECDECGFQCTNFTEAKRHSKIHETKLK